MRWHSLRKSDREAVYATVCAAAVSVHSSHGCYDSDSLLREDLIISHQKPSIPKLVTICTNSLNALVFHN